MTRMRQRIATRLKDAQNTAAMLTTFNEVDMRFIRSFSLPSIYNTILNFTQCTMICNVLPSILLAILWKCVNSIKMLFSRNIMSN